MLIAYYLKIYWAFVNGAGTDVFTFYDTDMCEKGEKVMLV